MKNIKVMIVDDSAVVRQSISHIVEVESNMEVVATAGDPIIAMRKLESVTPDVVVLDIEMPRMDGLTFLKKIMEENPMPVIICSSKAEEGSSNAMQALEFGAVDLIQKPKLGTKLFFEESRTIVADTIRAASISRIKKLSKRKTLPRKIEPKLSADVILKKPGGVVRIETTEKIVVIGASTGGTEALKDYLMQLPLDSPGTLIVQHMPENFTRAFAQRLNSICAVTVKEASNNDPVLRGHVLIAPGNKHMLLKRSGARYYAETKEGPLVSRHRPSVDVLFRSAARYGGKNVIGVIMTGMGDDGAKGMAEMNEAGAYNIAQNEESCVVFGMPNEAIKAGGVHKICDLHSIAGAVLKEARR